MKTLDSRCLFSIEQECQTSLASGGDGALGGGRLMEFLRAMSGLAPAMPGGAGFFNPYGRVYVDVGNHLELAACECDSPLALAQVVEAQHTLVQRAAAALAQSGTRVLLANNNHSGLLAPGAPVWGTHENYLIDVPAAQLADKALPFLVTRTYGGSGGVMYPTGHFVAGNRPVSLVQETGGGTTGNRAIYSTCREEHHMGPGTDRYRLHLINGDGHRSQYNLALHVGATALVLKTIQDPDLAATILNTDIRRGGESWVGTLTRLNRLAEPGEPPRVDPHAIAVQRIYLDGARRAVARMDAPADWMAHTLGSWQDTLDAYEREDRPWLAARLDAFAKYELYAAYLEQRGLGWRDVLGSEARFSQLALLDHDYHAISKADSIFDGLEADGVMEHRVAPRVEPGQEPDRWIPDVGTRARARARFIREHHGGTRYFMTWSCVQDQEENRRRTLYDPFAEEYEEAEAPARAVFDLFG